MKDGAESAEPTAELPKTETTSSFADILDFEEGRDGLRSILDTHFKMLYGYSSKAILWDAALNELHGHFMEAHFGQTA